MASDIFLDSSGIFAFMVKEDDRHDAAVRLLRQAERRKRRFLTTDHMLDETATLLKARGYSQLLRLFFDSMLVSRTCRVEWTDPERFDQAKAFFLKHADQEWSFTDCLSFLVMNKLGLSDALTKDHHFRQAGFVVLLA